MSIVPIDLTNVGLRDGSFIGIITSVELQVKTGEKWNNEGTTKCETVEEWLQYPRQTSEPDERGKFKALSRIHLRINFPELNGQSTTHDLYMSDASLPMLKEFLTKAGLEYGTDGFNPFDLLNRNIGCKIVTEEDEEYGTNYRIKSVYKA